MIKRFEEFVGTISSIQKNIQKIKKDKMEAFGLSGNHVMSLFYLGQYPEGLTAARLCQIISVDKAAISRVLAELVEKEYVYYPEIENGKKYRANAVLTEKGMEIAKEINPIICEVVEQIGGSLEESERTNMYHSLSVIANNLEEMARN